MKPRNDRTDAALLFLALLSKVLHSDHVCDLLSDERLKFISSSPAI